MTKGEGKKVGRKRRKEGRKVTKGEGRKEGRKRRKGGREGRTGVQGKKEGWMKGR